MREMKYIPKECSGEDSKLEGHVVMICPTFDERMDYIDQCSFQLEEDGTVKGGLSNLKSIRVSVGLSKKHYKEISLKRKDGSVEYKSFDDMAADSDMDSTLIEIAAVVMNGFKPSKN